MLRKLAFAFFGIANGTGDLTAVVPTYEELLRSYAATASVAVQCIRCNLAIADHTSHRGKQHARHVCRGEPGLHG